MEFLSFSEISKVHFTTFFDWLSIPYTETDKELKGKGFVVAKAKNLYFNPIGEDKGSIINFLANHKNISLRDAAVQIKKQFLDKQPELKREIPELKLTYHKYLEDRGITEEQAELNECGYCAQRSIMAGKVCFRVRDIDGNPLGYVGINPKTGDWFYPKGLKRPVYNLNRINKDSCLKLYSGPVDAIKNDGIALLGLSMTEEQEDLLARYDMITVVHPHPDNIVMRLARHMYVRVQPE